ncbi:Aste57867_831 [Aphanomyces stellatus]|uniref:Aste57867_831 protein n=1 Tax=Aphanomyces stellatus TaxID=120398 RepID=A0A485K3L0_9STRA|nr:hypothetical protein As57867_000830 [Aphanomyces stellatus]VFT78055.1 Aste57867_831 [Aphanomyces stellatus]
MDYTKMNTKYLDSLAIILPSMFSGEIELVLSRVALAAKWFNIFLYENPHARSLVGSTKKEEARRDEFEHDSNVMCRQIGIGAWGMATYAGMITAFWTTVFMFMSWIVEKKGRWLYGYRGLVFAMLVAYSVVVVGVCYVPFATWSVRHPRSRRQEQSQAQVVPEHQAIRGKGSGFCANEKTLTKTFRAGVLKHLSSEDYISFALYAITLVLSDLDEDDGENKFYAGKAGDVVKKLCMRKTYMNCAALEIPLDQLTDVAKLQVQVDKAINDEQQQQPQGPVVSNLFDYEVLDACVAHAFVDKGVNDLSKLIENPSIRECAICWNPHTNQVAVGLELKVLERLNPELKTNLIATVYLLALTNTINGVKWLRSHLSQVPLKAQTRFVNRTLLAQSFEDDRFFAADVVLKGADPKPRGDGATKSEMGKKLDARTGSASHLTGADAAATRTGSKSNLKGEDANHEAAPVVASPKSPKKGLFGRSKNDCVRYSFRKETETGTYSPTSSITGMILDICKRRLRTFIRTAPRRSWLSDPAVPDADVEVLPGSCTSQHGDCCLFDLLNTVHLICDSAPAIQVVHVG